MFDSILSFAIHKNNICKLAYCHLHDLYHIRTFLDEPVPMLLAKALESSCLDCCNLLLFGISKSKFDKLQRVQNSLSQVVSKTLKLEHITVVCMSFHWLPTKERIYSTSKSASLYIKLFIDPSYLSTPSAQTNTQLNSQRQQLLHYCISNISWCLCFLSLYPML